MEEAEIHDFARRLYNAHGPRAAAEAAQKARSCEESGKAEDAKAWRHVEAAIKQMLGPHQG